MRRTLLPSASLRATLFFLVIPSGDRDAIGGQHFAVVARPGMHHSYTANRQSQHRKGTAERYRFASMPTELDCLKLTRDEHNIYSIMNKRQV